MRTPRPLPAPVGAQVIEGSCVAYGQAAYALFIHLLNELLRIGGEADPSLARARLIEGVESAVPDREARAEILPFVAHL